MKVVVTGIGIVSAIGNNVAANETQLKLQKSGIDKAKNFKSRYTNSLNFGEVRLSDSELKKILHITKKGYCRTALLATMAFKEAINHSKLTKSEIESYRTGFISSSTVGGMCNTDELYADANMKGEPSEYIKTYGGGEHTLQLIKDFNIKGFTSTINTACSSSANAIMLGCRLIKAGRLDRVIVGGSDSLSKFSVNGFNSLMILSKEPCKPFDKNRDGLTLGEGSGYLVLERSDIAKNKKPLAEVIGYGNSNDAFHPSATSDEAFGPTLAMQRAIESTKIKKLNIDYINAHGTGTPNNDITELFAFNKIFSKIPAYNSTKSYTGHTLAAAGAIESIFSILSMKNNELYPSLNCLNPITKFNNPPIKKRTKMNINTVMSNSFGFGGNCTSIIFSKIK